jgi:microcystin degradation protein MlrC
VKPRVAIGGMAIESSTFSPHRSGAPDFTIVRGPALLAKYDALPSSVEWIPLVHARALPGGAVESAFYDSIKAELLAGLRAALPLDGVYLDIHGARTVVGMIDAEGDLAAAIREVVGPACLISASMDPHGNMSRRLVGAVDLATSHRRSPHDDAPLTKRRAVANLIGCLEREVRPLRAWVRVPVLLPGERACTRDDPARSIYGSLSAVERRDGIIDAAVWIGYAWADEPRCSAAIVVTGTDEAAIGSAARELGQRYWDVRASFDFSVPAAEAEACIANGLSQTARPFFISDSGTTPPPEAPATRRTCSSDCSPIRGSRRDRRPRSGRVAPTPRRSRRACAPERARRSRCRWAVRSAHRGRCRCTVGCSACMPTIRSAATSR